MHIQSSKVDMTSHRSYEKSASRTATTTTWGNGGIHQSTEQINLYYKEESGSGKKKENSGESTDDLFNRFKEAKAIKPSSIPSTQSEKRQLQSQTLGYLLQAIFGRGILGINSPFSGLSPLFHSSPLFASGGNYSEYYTHSEVEETSFSTKGTVVTEDGRNISFDVSLKMTRQFAESYGGYAEFGASLQESLKTCDPLVINLNGNAANVSDQEFLFDIDADGTLDKISGLAGGSGFLAYDKNGDGKINDGSELFGAQNGDGFADLAQYDEDGNGWIDEKDSIYDKLVVWTKDKNGNDSLCALSKAGVGAIYLGSADTDFSFQSKKGNETNALARKTGVFLYENGSAGTIQHLDFVKKDFAEQA